MAQGIFIDNCAFDRLFDLQIDPSSLVSNEFVYYVTGDVLTEIDAIPDSAEKAEKKAWISRVARSDSVVETGYFGFAEDPTAYGFGQGLLGDLSQVEYLAETSSELGALRGSGLPKNHTDRMLLSHAIEFAVLTDERVLGNRRLMDAAIARGAKVIRISEFDPGSESFIEFLHRSLPAAG